MYDGANNGYIYTTSDRIPKKHNKLIICQRKNSYIPDVLTTKNLYVCVVFVILYGYPS